MRIVGTLSSNTKSAAGGSGGRTVFIDDVVGDRNEVISCHVDGVPLIVVNRVVDDIVRPPIGVLEGDTVSAVGVDQIVDDERAWITAGDRDTAVARVATVAKDAVEFDVDVLIAVVTPHQRDRLTAGSSNRQTTYCYEFGLLDPNRPSLRTLRTRCTGDHHLSRLKHGIRFNDDTIELGCVGKFVFLDGDLFRIDAGLDADDIAGLRGINGLLNRGVARSLSGAGGIGTIDEDDVLLLRLYGPGTKQYKQGHKAQEFSQSCLRC